MGDDEVEHGKDLVILGILVEITDEGFACKPSLDKAVKLLDTIRTALREDHQRPGDAGTLARDSKPSLRRGATGAVASSFCIWLHNHKSGEHISALAWTGHGP